MTTKLKQYWAIIEEWKRRYPIPPPGPISLDLTKKKVGCYRCGKLSKTTRHHTGSDFFFAQLLPHEFAGRYIQFHPDDVAALCRKCHRGAHRAPRFHALYNALHVDLAARRRNRGITKEWCEGWMKKFREEFEDWVKTYKPRSTLVTKTDVKATRKQSRTHPRLRS